MSIFTNAMFGSPKAHADPVPHNPVPTDNDITSEAPLTRKESIFANPMKHHQASTSLEAERIRNEGLTFRGVRTDKIKPDSYNSPTDVAVTTTSELDSSGPNAGFGHIGSRDNTHSGFGGSNQGTDTYGRDTANFGVTQGYAQTQTQDRRAGKTYASDSYPTDSSPGSGMNRGNAVRQTEVPVYSLNQPVQGQSSNLNNNFDTGVRNTSANPPSQFSRDQNIQNPPVHHHHGTDEQQAHWSHHHTGHNLPSNTTYSDDSSASRHLHEQHHGRLSDTVNESINPTTGHHYGTSGVTIGHYDNTDVSSRNVHTDYSHAGQESLESTFVPGTSPDSGVGIHARQFSRQNASVDPGVGKTTYVHATSPVKTTTHGFDPSDRSGNLDRDNLGSPPNTRSTNVAPPIKSPTDRVDLSHRPRDTDKGNLDTSTSSNLQSKTARDDVGRGGLAPDECPTCHMKRSSQIPPPGPTTMVTTTDTEVTESVSPLHLRPGETVVEKETRVHRGIGPTEHKAGHTTTTTSSTFEDSAGKPLNKGNLNDMRKKGALGGGSTNAGAGGGITSTGKATMSDKIMGGVEKTAGKLVGNPNVMEHGEATAAGRLNPTKN